MTLVIDLSSPLPWSFRDTTSSRWQSAIVPGCVHRDLLRHKLIPDPFWGSNERGLDWVAEKAWMYRVRFELSAEVLAQKHIELVFDGLDTLATVRVNGTTIAQTDNMFVGYRFDVKSHVHVGANELSITFASATKFIRTHRSEHTPKEINDPIGGCTRIRKEQCQFGWDWAPRLVTAGIWQNVRLEAWSMGRLKSVRVAQTHRRGTVILDLTPEVEDPSPSLVFKFRVLFEGACIAETSGLCLTIKNPELWWPNGQGEQPLYTLEVEVRDGERMQGRWTRRIGLRRLRLRRERDRWGESFQFVVNGRPIFAKGASWIPAHSFVAGLSREDYQPLLQSAVNAHMNMLRVWGGGVYEDESFYDLCDELGLLVWHDFMFSCTLYPGDSAFLESVRREAEYQVIRLRHRTCLALWCGNNELELLNADALAKRQTRKNYDAVFRKLLPEAVELHDGVTPYWRSSPSRSDAPGLENGERSGNTHYWDVWHRREPVKSYELKVFRFVSEFGMQSFSSLETAKTFCPPDEINVFSPTMENHQKNPAGNQIILDYLSRRYRFPKDYAALSYLSQLNQAYCMQVGVEHYRRNSPRCSGTLYWQLNDCWPVASWSSLEFGGRWKALHYTARRFYAPTLVSAHVHGDETIGIGNRRNSSVRTVDIFTVHDSIQTEQAVLRWQLCSLDGKSILHGIKPVTLRYGRGQRQKSLDLRAPIDALGAENLYLQISLSVKEKIVSEASVLLCAPRQLALTRGETKVTVALKGKTQAVLSFTSDVFQHRFTFDFRDLRPLRCSDNYFDLPPGETRTVLVEFNDPVSQRQISKQITFMSLVDTY